MAPLTKIFTSNTHYLHKIILLFTASINALVAIGVLYGWIVNSTVLKSVFPHLTPMNPLTAICFIALALCFACFTVYPHNNRIKKSAATVSAVLIILFAGSMLLHYIFGMPFRVDRLLFPSRLGINRMAPTTAACFSMVGLALLGYVHLARYRWIVRVLGLITSFIALYALIGFAYGIQPVYGVAFLNPMAIHTSILFLLTAITLIALTIEKFVVYISRSLLTTYLIAVLVFIFLSIMSFRSFTQLNADNTKVQNLYSSQSDVDTLRTALLNAETGQRGYLLTSNVAYLAPYNAANDNVDISLHTLSRVSPNILSPAEYSQLQSHVHNKMAELAQTITLRKMGKSVDALTIVQSGRGKNDLDAARTILNDTDARIHNSLQLEINHSRAQNQNSLLLLSISTATILSLLLASLYLLQENLNRQHVITSAIESEQEITIAQKHDLESEVSTRIEELEKLKDSLEIEVQKRTDELKAELNKSQQQNSFMIHRELRMVELKSEIEALRIKLKG